MIAQMSVILCLQSLLRQLSRHDLLLDLPMSCSLTTHALPLAILARMNEIPPRHRIFWRISGTT